VAETECVLLVKFYFTNIHSEQKVESFVEPRQIVFSPKFKICDVELSSNTFLGRDNLYIWGRQSLQTNFSPLLSPD
jgi:hypothetical protein